MKNIFDMILYLHADIDTRNSISIGYVDINNDQYEIKWNTCMDGGGFYFIKNNHSFLAWNDIEDINVKKQIKKVIFEKIQKEFIDD